MVPDGIWSQTSPPRRLSRSVREEVAHVVERHDEHEQQQQPHADEVDERLALRAEPLAAPQYLNQHQQHAPAVQRRDWQRVDEGQVQAEVRREVENQVWADLWDRRRDLASDVDD